MGLFFDNAQAIGLLIGLVIAIIINFVIAKKFEEIAFDKGYTEEKHTFAVCFWLGAIGYIYVAALPDLTAIRRSAEQSRKIEGMLKSIEQKLTNTTNNVN